MDEPEDNEKYKEEMESSHGPSIENRVQSDPWVPKSPQGLVWAAQRLGNCEQDLCQGLDQDPTSSRQTQPKGRRTGRQS